MICSKCGKEIENGAKFCTNCGAPMNADDPVKMQGNANAFNGNVQGAQPAQNPGFTPNPNIAPNQPNGQNMYMPQGNGNYQYGQGQMQQPQQMMAKPKKKVNVGLIVALVAAVVIFILGGTGFFMTRLSADEKMQVEQTKTAIENIGAVDENSGNLIITAEELYADLNWKERLYINNYSELKQARSDYDTVKVNKATELINAIGEVTMDSGEVVLAAQEYYSTLSDEQKAMVTNSADLESAVTAYDEAVVGNAETLITAIGTVTADSKEAIEAAEEAYDALSESQKKMVSNSDTLTQARSDYEAALVQNCIDEIDAIGEVTLDSLDQIALASDTYEALSEENKLQVTNYDDLLAKIDEYDELVAEEELKKSALNPGDTYTTDSFKVTYKRSKVTDTILPNNTSGTYHYYQVNDSDYTMLDIVFTVENISNETKTFFDFSSFVFLYYDNDEEEMVIPSFVVSSGSDVESKSAFDSIESGASVTLHVVIQLDKAAKSDGKPIAVKLMNDDELKYIVVRE